MAALGGLVAWEVWKFLPEPARGGQSWIGEGQEEIRSEADVKEGKGSASPTAGGNGQGDRQRDGQSAGVAKAQQSILQMGVKPREQLVLGDDPTQRTLLWALGYVLRIRTYALLILASSFAYYFFAGIRTFGTIFLTGDYGISRSSVSALGLVIGIGALIGIVVGGRISGRFLDRGWTSARVVVAGAALFLSVLCFAPGIWFRSVAASMPLLTAGAFFLGAANPSIAAARLDIMVPQMWGRAESSGMAVRAVLEGGAPLLFGAVSVWLGGGTIGLKWTFLLMLIPLLIAAALAIPARRAYPRDVATAAESVRRMRGRGRRRVGETGEECG